MGWMLMNNPDGSRVMFHTSLLPKLNETPHTMYKVVCPACHGIGGNCEGCNGSGHLIHVEKSQMEKTLSEQCADDQAKERNRIQWQTKLSIVYQLINNGCDGLFLSDEQKDRLQKILDAINLAERAFLR